MLLSSGSLTQTESIQPLGVITYASNQGWWGPECAQGYLDKMFDVKMEGVCTRVWLFDHLFKNRSP